MREAREKANVKSEAQLAMGTSVPRFAKYLEAQGLIRDPRQAINDFRAGTHTGSGKGFDARLNLARSSKSLKDEPISEEKPAGEPHAEVDLVEDRGIYRVPVSLNRALDLTFVLDSGASDVSIPADVVLTLMRTETINREDFIGTKSYVTAEGTVIPSVTFRIRELKVGASVLKNVVGSVADIKGELLLGQSFLKRFKSWSIDNDRHTLILE
jgi:clan AA aspartic protease (TIGR02281 family)